MKQKRHIKFRVINQLNFIYFLICLCLMVLVAIISIVLIGIDSNSGTGSDSDIVIIDIPEITPVPPSTPLNVPTPILTTPIPTLQPQIDPEIKIGFINKSGVNFRKIPQGEIIDSLRKGSSINIIGAEVNGFYYISYEDTFGYVACEFVSFGEYVPPTPTPTPRYGKWDKEDYLLLATTIYCEASVKGGLPEAVAVGWVIRNRLEDRGTWGDKTWLDVISRRGQFSVYSERSSSKFQKVLKKIASEKSGHFETAKRAARYVMQGRTKYKIPEDVQFFCSNSYYNRNKKSNGNWGSHKYYKKIGDTVFFYS